MLSKNWKGKSFLLTISIHQKMLRDQNQHELEKRNASDKYEELYKRLRRAEREVEDSKKEMLQLQEKISNLEHEKMTGIEQVRNLNSTHEAQLKALSSKYDSLIQDLNVKLETTTESESTLSRDLQRLISNQRVMSEKWKDESEQIKSHYEQVNLKLKDQIAQFQTHIHELELKIQKNGAVRKDLIDQVTNEKKQYKQLYQNYMTIKKQKDGLTRQISACLQKENELIEERKKIS
jgi:predicted  nucleic acid-binding Zn-ribbon protein